jgi:2-polyprenyl-3-methyl-5-hydroxy-6-metoxy-1,4-benzoquinol methylase
MALTPPGASFAGLKSLVRRMSCMLGLNVRYQVTPGVSLLGLNVFRDSVPGMPRERAAYALDATLALHPKSVLDVGSGGGHHARAFADSGAGVVCVDYGTSVYASNSAVRGLTVFHGDFAAYVPPTERFDVVWASHVLEHQRNVGTFIERLVACCKEDGHVCITLPDPHRNLWGGHLTLWSPGLLAYNIVLCGLDISAAKFIRGTNEFSILFSPKRAILPPLTFDSGDLKLLKGFLPGRFSENSDPWREW